MPLNPTVTAAFAFVSLFRAQKPIHCMHSISVIAHRAREVPGCSLRCGVHPPVSEDRFADYKRLSAAAGAHEQAVARAQAAGEVGFVIASTMCVSHPVANHMGHVIATAACGTPGPVMQAAVSMHARQLFYRYTAPIASKHMYG